MKIKLSDDYQLTSDRLQYIIQEKKVVKEGKTQGKEYWDNIGYYSTLQGALDSYVNMRVRISDKNTLTELLAYLKEIKKEVIALVEVE